MISRQAWCNEECKKECDAKYKPHFGVLGLHTCGNLAPTLLKLFAETSNARALLSVGCCYMKLNTGHECQGYPLSGYVSKLPHHHLSYEAREMACHGLEGYIQRLKENGASLKIHCYRAALEKIIVKYHPDMKHVGLRGVKHVEKLQFHEYAYKALSKSSLHIPNEDILSPVTESNLQHWKKVVAVYSLRLLTAPVVESLILLDRMLFLFEKGCPSCILPVFDPALSPRNHVLLSVKIVNPN